ncbi:hypothetical protein GCM10010211_44290 [Streptomyces albospinus]|uniref:Integral membrane protein n=1 Tax=Streptomyces albospinus TaxID=285515 RepID=A0ABQ2V805_9ACTN|nr:hypothetical protein [Streptomyces albospinus]GGU73477.1 hypothetical protein GCM10010211_44290 [Streptomyces albospinus]
MRVGPLTARLGNAGELRAVQGGSLFLALFGLGWIAVLGLPGIALAMTAVLTVRASEVHGGSGRDRP